MKTTRFLALTAISIALTFTFSGCSSDDDGDDTPSSTNSSSSVGNTGGGGSSSSGGNTGGGSPGDPDATVDIGGQTWKKYNLNVQHNSGKGNSWCYDNNESHCDTAGRLYDWAAAMNLPSSCNSEPCSGQITNPHQGLCPNGFHIPTKDELEALLAVVGATGLENANGFAAVRGGRHREDGGFQRGTQNGYLWSATESGDEAYRLLLTTSNTDGVTVEVYGDDKSTGFSVRCLQD
jgi:hypothetical protein